MKDRLSQSEFNIIMNQIIADIKEKEGYMMNNRDNVMYYLTGAIIIADTKLNLLS